LKEKVTSLSEAESKAVLRAVLAGQTVADALNVFGIRYDEWIECENNEQAVDVLEKAEAYFSMSFITGLMERCRQGEWRACKEFLEKRFPERWSGKPLETQVRKTEPISFIIDLGSELED